MNLLGLYACEPSRIKIDIQRDPSLRTVWLCNGFGGLSSFSYQQNVVTTVSDLLGFFF